MSVPRVELAEGYSIARILNGGWQLAAGHRAEPIDARQAVDAMTRLAEAGLTTFDGADIYTGVEELFGRFLKSYPRPREIQVHTKLVPDRSALPTLDRRYVESIVDRSLVRLGVERLDLVQFHWWDHQVPGLLDALGWLDEMREAGKIRLLGATNFDAAQLRRIVEVRSQYLEFVGQARALRDQRGELLRNTAHQRGDFDRIVDAGLFDPRDAPAQKRHFHQIPRAVNAIEQVAELIDLVGLHVDKKE